MPTVTPDAPPPSPAPEADNAERALLPGAEPLPNLSSPPAGSTADIGNGHEGIYEETGGGMIIRPDGRFARRTGAAWAWGALTVKERNWTLDAASFWVANSMATPITGSGVLLPKASIIGTYSKAGVLAGAWGPLEYSVSNALAVTQADLAGNWSFDENGIGMTIAVDATGAFTGTTAGSVIGVCSVAGTVLQSEPQTRKNNFDLALTARNAALPGEQACALDPATYSGPAGIVLAPAGRYVSNGYRRHLAIITKTDDFAQLTIGLRKQ